MFSIGQQIYFEEEPDTPYEVKAVDERFSIMTRPVVHDGEDTVMYTILDLETWMRGTNNLIFNPYDYATQEGIDECMKDLKSAECECELSRRNSIPVVLSGEESAV